MCRPTTSRWPGMNSPMPSMKLAVDLDDLTEIEVADGHAERLECVGPSLWGSIYRSAQDGDYYRVIPSAYGVTAEMRDEVRQWRTRPRRPGIAPILDTQQSTVDGQSCLPVRYGEQAESTLRDALASEDAKTRVRAVAATMRALPGWRARVGSGLMPTPSDIVLRGPIAILLAHPYWGVPPIGALLDEPERAMHLPPEILRGRPDQ